MLRFILLFLAGIISQWSYATTWNEPWADKVIKESESFVYANVQSYEEDKGVVIEVVKTLGGENLTGKIEITDFYLLDVCSISGGHGPGFHFKNIASCYFFIKRNKEGKYCIATPTTGFDAVKNDTVRATYRHSYHQALVPVSVYENTMIAIFNNYHSKPYDDAYINAYIQQYLSLEPAGFDKIEIDTFFAQHVALECIYHLRLAGKYSLIIPFLESTNFHSRVSAARALISYDMPECKEALMKIIEDKKSNYFLQVICVWTLSEFKPKELKKRLSKIEATASEDDNGFGGNIMDPRVCTFFPTVKQALETLIKTL